MVVALWGLFGLFVLHVLFGINVPAEIPTGQFLVSSSGRVLDVGAGSGRAAVGLLQARPRITVTALDIYSGYFGIDDNTPERLMRNARIGGVADRVEVKVGDARSMPLTDASYDGVISTYAIDHIGPTASRWQSGRWPEYSAEWRVPARDRERGLVGASAGAVSTRARAPSGPDPARWRALLENSGLRVVEQGTRPATLYFVSRKPGP